jgi:hypothetical protein
LAIEFSWLMSKPCSTSYAMCSTISRRPAGNGRPRSGRLRSPSDPDPSRLSGALTHPRRPPSPSKHS